MHNQFISIIESRLQFVITITTVFVVAMPDISPQGYTLVLVYLITYLVFAGLASKLAACWLKWINISILIGIGSFMIPFLVIASSKSTELIPNWQIYMWKGSALLSIGAMMVAPFLVIILTIIGSYFAKSSRVTNQK